nr:SulP family inorganic anion transporter [uncultured Sphingomonas sp.]
MKPKILSTLPGYTRKLFAADILAGVTVALVALPLSIAIAIGSGAPPIAGLVTAAVAGFLISALGGSRVQIGGPTGAFIVVVYGIIHAHGMAGLATATLMAGVILLAAGFLRLGRLIHYIPDAVIEGFTIGIAVVIAVAQVRDLAGLQTGALPADFIPKVEGLWAARGSFNPVSLALGLASIAALLVMRKALPRLPTPMLVIGAASLLVLALLPGVATVAHQYGAIQNGLPTIQLPDLSGATMIALLPSAITIALLAGIESLLSAIVADRMIGAHHRSNAELIAQGAANIASPLVGGLPATGAIARTATNVQAGGRTPVAGMVHALIILAVLLFAAPLANGLAMPALAALLIVTAWSMSEPHRWPERLAMPKSRLALLILTAVMTVLVDLTAAILVGTAIGFALRWWEGRNRPGDWHMPDRGIGGE